MTRWTSSTRSTRGRGEKGKEASGQSPVARRRDRRRVICSCCWPPMPPCSGGGGGRSRLPGGTLGRPETEAASLTLAVQGQILRKFIDSPSSRPTNKRHRV